jgi:hypothetical protein
MTTTQMAERETLYRKIIELPDEGVKMVIQYIDGLEAHEPNEETIAAILEGDELARIYCSRFVENDLKSKDTSTAR